MRKIIGFVASLVMGVLCIVFFPVLVVIALFAILKIDRDKKAHEELEAALESADQRFRQAMGEANENLQRTISDIMSERDADQKGREILARFQAEQDNEW